MWIKWVGQDSLSVFLYLNLIHFSYKRVIWNIALLNKFFKKIPIQYVIIWIQFFLILINLSLRVPHLFICIDIFCVGG